MTQNLGPLIFSEKEGVARITLNRPEVHNAFNTNLLGVLRNLLKELHTRQDIRLLILEGNGPSFCSGADAQWMRQMAGYSLEENRADAAVLFDVMHALSTLSYPVIAKVHGAVMGGGVGLLACADIALAEDRAFFAFSEVYLGLIPAIISPFITRAIGARQAKKLFLTGERFSASDALSYGLIHEVVPAAELEETIQKVSKKILKGGAHAQQRIKQLCAKIEEAPSYTDQKLARYTINEIAEIRAGREAQEGLAAFLEKRSPTWQKR